jgi:hypothetical protein
VATVSGTKRRVLYTCHVHGGRLTHGDIAVEGYKRQTILRLVELGWLVPAEGGYQITDAGRAAYPFTRENR